MEKKLRLLFDYQKFAGNPKLQAAVDSIRKRSREMIQDDAELVSAAGAPYFKPAHDDDPETHL